jgi:hypothetical protein
MTEPPSARLLALLEPILSQVAALQPERRDSDAAVLELEEALTRGFPPDCERVRAIGAEIERGIADGWLCDRGEPHARFSRLAKPTDRTAGLSIDVVSMTGDAVEHTHPRGEVTIGFAAAGHDPSAVRFEGRPPGWVFLRPGSRHVPRVDGGRMHLMYFLPDGAVEWHFAR